MGVTVSSALIVSVPVPCWLVSTKSSSYDSGWSVHKQVEVKPERGRTYLPRSFVAPDAVQLPTWTSVKASGWIWIETGTVGGAVTVVVVLGGAGGGWVEGTTTSVVYVRLEAP